MNDIRRVVRIFLGSPGDLSPERLVAKSVCEEFNHLWAATLGYQIELVGWEDTVATFGRGQEVINRDLRTCEMFVGVVWKRWGTPPDQSGQYRSGFEEEYNLSIERRESGEDIEISLFLKNIDDDAAKDPGEQLKLVLDFRKKLIEEKKVYYESFSESADFGSKFRRLITKYVQQKNSDTLNLLSKEQSKSSDEASPDQTQSASTYRLLAHNSHKFLSNLLNSSTADDFTLTSLEVARTRLIGCTLYTYQNDRTYIQTHDANIIYLNRLHVKLGEKEVDSLVASGLRNIDNEHVPLWYWVSVHNATHPQYDILELSAHYNSSGKTRVGAFKALKMMRKPFAPTDDDRQIIFQQWTNADQDVRSSALSYLAEVGSPSELEWIRSEYERSDSKTQASALESLLRVTARQNRISAVKVMYELQPSSVSGSALAAVFDDADSMPTSILLEGLEQRANEVRRKVSSILFDRSAIDEELATSLISDEDIGVRYFSACSLARHNKPLSGSDISKLLIIKSSSPSSIFGGGDNKEWFEKYANYVDSISPLDLLRNRAASESMYKKDAFNALARRQVSKLREELHSRITTKYSNVFDKHVSELPAALRTPDQLKQVNSIKNYVCEGHTLSAVEILAEKGSDLDLDVVRGALKDSKFKAPISIYRYFSRYGSWIDVPFLIQVAENGPPYSPGLYISNLQSKHLRAAGKCLVALSRSRYIDLLDISKDRAVQPNIISAMPAIDITRLTDDYIISLLLSKSENFRKAAALKIIATQKKARIARLLDRYVTNEREYFYNVVFWLDMALTIGAASTSYARQALLDEWL